MESSDLAPVARASDAVELSLAGLSLSTTAHDKQSPHNPLTRGEKPPANHDKHSDPRLDSSPEDFRGNVVCASSSQDAGSSSSQLHNKVDRPEAIADDGSPAPALPIASVAATILASDLASHLSFPTDAVVILQDDCYGHRFSRPRTTKSHLSMIVERPERLRASVLGISAAYVRLGHRHLQDMRPNASITTAFGAPPFHIRKTSRVMSLLDPAVVAVHGKSWLTELHAMAASAGTKLAIGSKEVERVPNAFVDGNHASKKELHDGDLYLCKDSLAAFEGALGGVCDGVDAVFSSHHSATRAFVAIRPPGHHCAVDYPSGFCWLNNVHVGIEYAAQRHGLTHAAILDFDLHHGDGSQDIAWARNARSANMPRNTPLSKRLAIGYYSLHDINSYPCESGDQSKVSSASLCIDNAHGQSIWNVHLEPYSSATEFWNLYEQKYKVLLAKARTFLRLHTARLRASPKAGSAKSAIFISAGFDASQWEGAGMQRHSVNVPTDFYARFTADVVKLAMEEDTACEGRVISVLEGGYSDRALTSGVLSHVAGLCHARTSDKTSVASSQPTCNPEWWSHENLQALEQHISPALPPVQKKVKGGLVPTYASPTTSFSHKVVDPEKFSKSASETMRYVPAAGDEQPPLREMDWMLATHELSKLLIPSVRSTTSCTAESLAIPRVKKEVPVVDKLSAADSPRTLGRQLRERKSKPETPVATPRKTSQKMKKPRAPLPVPSVAAHSVPVVAASTTPTSAVPASDPLHTTPVTTDQSVDAQLDSLSSGVRKLKLRVCSQEEWDRKESERGEEPTVAVNGVAPAASAREAPRKIKLSFSTTASLPVTPVSEHPSHIDVNEQVAPSTAPPKTISQRAIDDRLDTTQSTRPVAQGPTAQNTKQEQSRPGSSLSGRESQPALPVWTATGSIPFAPVLGQQVQQPPH